MKIMLSDIEQIYEIIRNPLYISVGMNYNYKENIRSGFAAGVKEMESKKAVREFMIYIALGLAGYIPIICVIFLIIVKFALPVLLGALYGSAVVLGYYYLFARAIKNAAALDPEDVKKRIQAAYSLRMLLLVIFMGAGLWASVQFGIFHWLPMILALLAPRFSIAVYQIKEKRNADKSSPADEKSE